jgi:hypothetical protein
MAASTRWTALVSRRSFLRWTAISAGLLTVSRLRLAPALAATSTPALGLRVLTPQQAEILTAIVERMVHSGTPDMPAVRETRTIETIDQALLQLDASTQSQLRWLITLFQWGPPLFQFKLHRFTTLRPEDQDDYIRDWATSSVATRRIAFQALKNLSMLGYYSQDATWKAIHYDGPWAPRPRRVLSSEC